MEEKIITWIRSVQHSLRCFRIDWSAL